MAVCTPRREASEETSPAETLSSDFRPPESRGNAFLWLKPPVRGTQHGRPGHTTATFHPDFLIFLAYSGVLRVCPACTVGLASTCEESTPPSRPRAWTWPQGGKQAGNTSVTGECPRGTGATRPRCRPDRKARPMQANAHQPSRPS